jgi:hypothetical protein
MKRTTMTHVSVLQGLGSAVIRWLFERDLVDEIILLTYLVVVGQGTRLFPGTGPRPSARTGGIEGGRGGDHAGVRPAGLCAFDPNALNTVRRETLARSAMASTVVAT